MNKIKHLYIILLSILFMNNIISMENQDYMVTEQESQLLSLPAELMIAIINETVIQQVKETINKWNDIFQQPKKINLQEIALVSQQFKDVLNVASKSPSLKNYLNQLIKELKSKRFDELFENLKIKSIEEYKVQGLSTEDLNRAFINILNKDPKSKEYFKVTVKLILAGVDVNSKSQYGGNTALMKASYGGYKEVVEILIKSGASINTKNNNGFTALMRASINDHKDIVQILIDKGASINTKNEYGFTALMLASSNGHKDIVELLIDKGADIDAKSTFNNDTALMVASKKGHKDIVKILINEGANVNSKDYEGNTALMIASEKGYKDIVEILKEAGSK
ncbi:ankyrin repeat domain-containing protein [Candidatus Babela massiliensis]|uniref:Ankyrin repeats containing protein n=1 Tax=Candidatus Babela massiliensis TaxID=673862 RepID=V6DF32_9BACT|nr:ankyrin repeat domain-containing protein [Candidatus Babela massiliensis]CDK30207.1 Ankyrin repeats containing protein [Candidatus Babela massiliensis]